MKASLSAWLVAFRLHTLPLALSTIILGSFLAAFHRQFHWSIALWAVLTTLFLQILSNLANDYGDAASGVDNQERLGPKRGLQSGALTRRQVRNAIILFVLLSLISGSLLIYLSFGGSHLLYSLLCLLAGIGAIVAALKYTMGKNPYGYSGYGDVFVFLFFGLAGVMGTYFLHTHELTLRELLPAMAMGCFSTGVLNLNNLRDRVNDAAYGKRTLVVKLGLRRAKQYHAFLLGFGMCTAILYSLFSGAGYWQWIYLLSFVGMVRSIRVVFRNERPEDLYPELKKLALSTLLFSVLFGVGLLL